MQSTVSGNVRFAAQAMRAQSQCVHFAKERGKRRVNTKESIEASALTARVPSVDLKAVRLGIKEIQAPY